MIAYLFRVLLISSMLYVFYKMFLQRETFFQSNRIYFLSGMVLSLLLPLLFIPVYIEIDPISTLSLPYIPLDTSVLETVPMPKEEMVSKSYNFYDIAGYLYLIGVGVLFIKYWIDIASVASIIYKNPKWKSGKIFYVETNQQTSPFSFFVWIVFNKNQFTKEELVQIIAHEQIHVKQWHSIDMILVQFFAIIQWFNPFIWLYKKELQQNLEYIADKEAQAAIENTKNYQYLLLKTGIDAHPFALSNNFFNSHLKKRIMMLQTNPSHQKKQLKYVLLLPLIALFLYAFNTKEVYVPKKNFEEENPISNKEIYQQQPDSLYFVSPVSAENITGMPSGYGMRMNPFTHKRSMHNGMDFSASKGTDVLSAAKGVILEIGEDNESGKYIRIAHPDGFQTNYKHLSAIQIEKGEDVQTGEIIGNVGSTGKSLAPHLHFELLKNGEYVNPIKYITIKEKKPIDLSSEDYYDGYNVGFDSATTDAQLEKIKKDFKEKNHISKFEFTEVKRNDKGRIIALKIATITNGLALNFHVASDKPIATVLLLYKKKGKKVKIITDNQLQKREKIKTSSFHFITTSKPKKKPIATLIKTSDTTVFTVTANTTDKELKDIEAYFTKKNLQVTFSNIVRNKKGNINAYTLQTTFGNNKTTKRFISSGDKEIHPFTLQSVNDGNEILVRQFKDNASSSEILLIKEGSLSFHSDESSEMGTVIYEGEDYFYKKEDNEYHFHNKFGDKILSKELIKKLTDKIDKKGKQTLHNNSKLQQKTGFVQYNNRQYFYYVDDNSAVTFYNKFGDEILSKELIKKLIDRIDKKEEQTLYNNSKLQQKTGFVQYNDKYYYYYVNDDSEITFYNRYGTVVNADLTTKLINELVKQTESKEAKEAQISELRKRQKELRNKKRKTVEARRKELNQRRKESRERLDKKREELRQRREELRKKTNTNRKKLILIDIGHGGSDKGATVKAIHERDIVQSIAKRIKLFHHDEDFEIRILNEADRFMSLEDRIEKINKMNPDLVISLHVNQSDNAKDHGVEAYVSRENRYVRDVNVLARTLLNYFENSKLMPQGVKPANLYLLRKIHSPAITLELGYLSNKKDRKYITSEEGKNKITGIILGFLNSVYKG